MVSCTESYCDGEESKRETLSGAAEVSLRLSRGRGKGRDLVISDLPTLDQANYPTNQTTTHLIFLHHPSRPESVPTVLLDLEYDTPQSWDSPAL